MTFFATQTQMFFLRKKYGLDLVCERSCFFIGCLDDVGPSSIGIGKFFLRHLGTFSFQTSASGSPEQYSSFKKFPSFCMPLQKEWSLLV